MHTVASVCLFQYFMAWVALETVVIKSTVIKMASYRAITDVLLALSEKSLAFFMKAFLLYRLL